MINLETLSTQAKAIAGSMFGISWEKKTVTFHLVESKPSPQAQAAFDELVAQGVLTSEPFNKLGGITYKAVKDCTPAWKWMSENVDNPDIKFPVTVPIKK